MPDWDTVHSVDIAAPGEAVVSLSAQGDGLVNSRPDGRPLSGTSYAAPVVSGVVALIRSRSPQLSARQVMARIEDTAHHPADGWNAQVGHGVVDPLAAVSGGEPAPAPRRVAAAQTAPATSPDRRPPRRIAFLGTAICIAVVTVAVTGRRRSRH